jgi:hypothetical protein
MMAQAYKCGLFTIAANMPADGQTWKPILPYRVPLDGKRLYKLEDWLSSLLLEGPLGLRAWCLQERYLSAYLRKPNLDMGV